jgi:hypothetical protein
LDKANAVFLAPVAYQVAQSGTGMFDTSCMRISTYFGKTAK